jgi:hypothetical protein
MSEAVLWSLEADSGGAATGLEEVDATLAGPWA